MRSTESIQTNSLLNTPRTESVAPERRRFLVEGFTLVEMIVAIAVFSFVMLGATGALLSLVAADQKAEALKTTTNNLNLALESMTRNIRAGSNYQCGGVGGGDCQNNGSNTLAFTASAGTTMVYTLSGGKIMLQVLAADGSVIQDYSAITSSEIAVDHLMFYVYGTNPNDKKQPRVFINVGGIISPSVAGQAAIQNTRFDIQTFVSQRLLSI